MLVFQLEQIFQFVLLRLQSDSLSFLPVPFSFDDKHHIPVLQVYNKADLIYPEELPHGENIVPISAKKGMNMDGLLKAIEKALAKSKHHVIAVLPYSMGGMVETLHNNAIVKNVEYTADGIEVETVVDDILYGRLRDYIAMEL